MARGGAFVLCLTRSENDEFGPRIESHHNDSLSSSSSFYAHQVWDMTTGFWETALYERCGHEKQVLSGHRCDWSVWAMWRNSHGQKWSSLQLLRLTEGHVKCAHRRDLTAGYLWPLIFFLLIGNHISRNFFLKGKMMLYSHISTIPLSKYSSSRAAWLAAWVCEKRGLASFIFVFSALFLTTYSHIWVALPGHIISAPAWEGSKVRELHYYLQSQKNDKNPAVLPLTFVVWP